MSSVLRSGRVALGLVGRGIRASAPVGNCAPQPKLRSLINTIFVRNSAHGPWQYRTAAPKAPLGHRVWAELTAGIMWWWILWHVWHEPELLSGTEYPPIIPESWTDEELGIPPDEEGLGGRLDNYEI